MPRHTIDEAATIRALAKEVSNLAAISGDNGIEAIVDTLDLNELIRRNKVIQDNLARIFSMTKVRMMRAIHPDIPLTLRASCLYADAIQDSDTFSEYLDTTKRIWAQSLEAENWENYGSSRQKIIDIYHQLRITFFNILLKFQQISF